MRFKARLLTLVAAVAAAVTLTAVVPSTASASTAGGSITRSEVISRAASWNGTPYSTTTYKYGPGGDIAYRTDCSGYVSMALHLTSSLSTVTLPSVVTRISKDQLQPGDLVGVLGPNTGGNAGHVLLFNGWTDSSHTYYHAWEDDGASGVHAPTIPWPYWPNTSGPSPSLYAPYRYNNISGSTGGGGGLPAWPNVVEGQSGPDVQSAQYLLRYHGSSIAADGQFGPATFSATESFQSAHGLSVDGQIGPQTWGALIVQVQQGSSGDAVRAAQVQLDRYGYNLTVDGSFGPATDSATRSFQSAHGLSVDGQIGPMTWQTLVGD